MIEEINMVYEKKGGLKPKKDYIRWIQKEGYHELSTTLNMIC